MRNKISIAEYLPDWIEMIFNPSLTHTVNFFVPISVLRDFSIIDNGVNCIDKNILNEYYSSMKEMCGGIPFDIKLYLVSKNNGSYGRILHPSFELFIHDLYSLFTHENLEDYNCDIYKDKIREEKNKLIKLRDGRVDELDKDFINRIKGEYNEEIEYIKNRNKFVNHSFREYLNKRIQVAIKMSSFFNKTRSSFNKPIDLEKMGKYLKLDEFYLAMTKQIIEVSKKIDGYCGKLGDNFYLAIEYALKAQMLKEKYGYHLEVETELVDGKKIKYSIDDAIREVNEIRIKHPEYTYKYVPNEEQTDYRDLSAASSLKEKFENFERQKSLRADWEIIPKGKLPKSDSQELKSKLDVHKTYTDDDLTKDEKLQIVVARQAFLSNTNYKYKMLGKNKFDGYVGYVYPNGKVIFEKTYTNLTPSTRIFKNATYVMNIDNFVEMSQYSKLELTDYIKQGGSDVKRIYHNKNWKENIMRVIGDQSYTPEIIDKIDSLISENKIERVSGQKV